MMPLPAPDSSILRFGRRGLQSRSGGSVGLGGGAGIRTEIETSPARASRHLQRKKQPNRPYEKQQSREPPRMRQDILITRRRPDNDLIPQGGGSVSSEYLGMISY